MFSRLTEAEKGAHQIQQHQQLTYRERETRLNNHNCKCQHDDDNNNYYHY